MVVKIALIHTVQSVLATFGNRIKDAIPNVKVVNTLDEFLTSDPAEKGEFTVNNMQRLFSIVKCAEMTEPDAIVVTCSTLSPIIEKISSFIKVPIITIDEGMIRKAVEIGSKITILATADSTVEPTKNKLISEAQKISKDINISVIVCPKAYVAIKAGDKQYHDEIIKGSVLKIKQQDVVILAQASMAHLEEDIQTICGCTVLSSPSMCIEQLKETLKK